jgi:elongation factor G
LSREDPSITVKVEEDTDQVLVSGLGELHLEILRDRIELEYGIKPILGPMRVSYRESVG